MLVRMYPQPAGPPPLVDPKHVSLASGVLIAAGIFKILGGLGLSVFLASNEGSGGSFGIRFGLLFAVFIGAPVVFSGGGARRGALVLQRTTISCPSTARTPTSEHVRAR